MDQVWGGFLKLLGLKGNITYLQKSTRVHPDITLMMCHHHMGTNSSETWLCLKIQVTQKHQTPSNPSLPPALLLSKLQEKLSAVPLLDSVSWVVSTCCNSWIQVLSCSSLNIKLCQQTCKTTGNSFRKSSDAQEWPT